MPDKNDSILKLKQLHFRLSQAALCQVQRRGRFVVGLDACTDAPSFHLGLEKFWHVKGTSEMQLEMN